MGSNSDWGISAASLTLPPFAAPNDGAIIIGPDLPECMQSVYDSAIFWRPPGTVAPDSAPWYFIAQLSAPIGGSTWQTVDHGFLLNDGIDCGYVVNRRIRARQLAGDIETYEFVGVIDTNGVTVANGPFITFQDDTSFIIDSTSDAGITGRLFVGGDLASFSNGHISGHCTGLTGKNNSTYSTMPTGQQIDFEKRYDATALEIFMSATFYTDNSDTGPQYAALIDGTDHFIGDLRPGVTAGVRHQFAAMAKRTGIDAGSYTIVPRWARVSGTGSVIVDSNDFFSLSVKEVSPNT